MKPTLLDFENKLKSAESIDAINSILLEFLKSYGIDMFAFTYYNYYPTSLNKLKYDFASPIYKAWHKHFIEEGYDDIDSTLDVVYRTSVPTFWSIEEQLHQAKKGREEKMRQDSIAFGIEKGISIPIHGPKEDFAILVLIQKKGQRCLEHIAEIQYELFSAAYYYYHYIHKKLIQSQEDVKFQLNTREIQCLTLLAKEYSVKTIAKELNLTERTVNHYMQQLNKKLGTKSKYQSVIKALSKGIIKI